MPKDFVGRTGLKMSELKAKGKPENPKFKKKGSGEFPSMADTSPAETTVAKLRTDLARRRHLASRTRRTGPIPHDDHELCRHGDVC